MNTTIDNSTKLSKALEGAKRALQMLSSEIESIDKMILNNHKVYLPPITLEQKNSYSTNYIEHRIDGILYDVRYTATIIDPDFEDPEYDIDIIEITAGKLSEPNTESETLEYVDKELYNTLFLLCDVHYRTSGQLAEDISDFDHSDNDYRHDHEKGN